MLEFELCSLSGSAEARVLDDEEVHQTRAAHKALWPIHPTLIVRFTTSQGARTAPPDPPTVYRRTVEADCGDPLGESVESAGSNMYTCR